MTRKKRSIKKELKANRTAGTLAFEHAVDLEFAIIDRMKELEINQSELAKKNEHIETGTIKNAQYST